MCAPRASAIVAALVASGGLGAAATGCKFSPGTAATIDAAPDIEIDAAVDAPPDVAIDAPRTDWWDPAWPKRRSITIHAEQLQGAVANFPVLVRLPASVGKPDGSDLRFRTGDNADPRAHDVDALDANGTTYLWVRMPNLDNTAGPQTLWLYYGNTAAVPSTASGAMVFGDQYVSVHHLGESLTDSTGKNHTASAPAGSLPTTVTDHIGRVRDFDGNDDYLQLPAEQDFDFTTELSVSAWVHRDQLDTIYQAIVTKGDTTWRLHRELETSFVAFATTANNANQNDCVGDVSINDNNWHHVAIVLSNGMKRLYVDGELDQLANGTSVPIDRNDIPVYFGRNANTTLGGDRNWDGSLDEIRISATQRDAAWIFAEHRTVATPGFVEIGAEEPYAP